MHSTLKPGSHKPRNAQHTQAMLTEATKCTAHSSPAHTSHKLHSTLKPWSHKPHNAQHTRALLTQVTNYTAHSSPDHTSHKMHSTLRPWSHKSQTALHTQALITRITNNTLFQAFYSILAFSALTLLAGHHPKTPSSLASFKSRLVLPFWYRLTRAVLE